FREQSLRLQQPVPGQVFSATQDEAARRREAREADRSLLPDARGTKVVAAVSTRAFIHLFERRASASADAKSDGLASVLLNEVEELAPYLFGDYQIIRTPDNREVA